jgi:hypothetical protein
VALDEAVAEAEEEADRLMADPERWREVEALADELLATEAVTFALAGPKATAFVRNKSRPPQGLPRAK